MTVIGIVLKTGLIDLLVYYEVLTSERIKDRKNKRFIVIIEKNKIIL
jgi:hypothetical protein